MTMSFGNVYNTPHQLSLSSNNPNTNTPTFRQTNITSTPTLQPPPPPNTAGSPYYLTVSPPSTVEQSQQQQHSQSSSSSPTTNGTSPLHHHHHHHHHSHHQQQQQQQQQPSHHHQSQQVIPQATLSSNGWNSLEKRGQPSPLGYPPQNNGSNSSNVLAPFNGYSNTQLPEGKPALPPRAMHEQQSSGTLGLNPSPLIPTFPVPQTSLILAHQAQSQNVPQNLPSPGSLAQSPNDMSQVMLNAVRSPSNSRTLTNSKRAAQNRAAQRAFRQRKDRYIKDLEQKAKDLDNVKKMMENLQKEKQEMSSMIGKLRAELARYKGDSDMNDDDGHGRHRGNNSSGGGGVGGGNNGQQFSHSSYTSTTEDDTHGLGEEPWMRQKDRNNSSGSNSSSNSNRNSNNNTHHNHNNGHFNDHSSLFDNRPNYPYSPNSSPESSPSNTTMNRTANGLPDVQVRSLSPSDSSMEPLYRSDYRHSSTKLSSNSPPQATLPLMSNRNRGAYLVGSSGSGCNNGNNNNNNNNNNNSNGHRGGVVPGVGEEDSDRVMGDDLCELLRTRSRPALPQAMPAMNYWPSINQANQSTT
ncbi:hypothetical protein G9A89_014896 [Geosiphon pyriformis]|nr:hypothetical protein G9A89_014896 [Geosiphon pyriformis]